MCLEKEKVTAMSFLDGLIQAKPPLKPFVDAKTNLSVFISLLLPKVHFLKVTRVVTLAPPMKFTPTTQLSGGTFLHGGHTKEGPKEIQNAEGRKRIKALPPRP